VCSPQKTRASVFLLAVSPPLAGGFALFLVGSNVSIKSGPVLLLPNRTTVPAPTGAH
jgi:hypothetical protein